jgi:ADP-ribose pyrophosphatase
VGAEVLVRSRRIYQGRVVNLRVDAVRLPDGREVDREVVEHRGAAVIVPLTAMGEVLMVRQFRYVVNQTLVELPAGGLEPGETPLAAAVRELAEEVGAAAGQWEPLGVMFPSPGILTEVYHLFLATDLTEGRPYWTADEDLIIERLSLPEAVDRIRRGEVRDAKSVAGLLLVARRQGI